MMRKFKNIISVFYSIIKFLLIKLFKGNKFKFYIIERFSPNTTIEIRKNAKIELGKKVRAHSGVKLNASSNGLIKIGDNTAFNNGCIVACHKKIEIGNDCTFGPGVLVYDHDHDYTKNGKINGKAFICEDIKIGKNCWIGANSIILRGTTIGDNCVIAAGSIIKGKYKDNVIIIQKRETTIKEIKREKS